MISNSSDPKLLAVKSAIMVKKATMLKIYVKISIYVLVFAIEQDINLKF